LKPELPFREVAGLYRVPQIAAVEIGVSAIDLERLVPYHGLHAQFWLPVEFDEGRFTLRIDEAKRVDAEPFHETKRPRDRSVGHDPERHVRALRIQRDEIPEIIVRGLRLREPAVGLLLGRMDDVGKFDRVLNKENGDVVSDEIPVALLGIELDRKPAHITRQIGRPLTACHSRKSHEGWGFFAGALKQIGAGDVAERCGNNQRAPRAPNKAYLYSTRL